VVTLKVDYDGRIPARCLERVAVVCRVHRVRVVGVAFRRTAHGYHMTVDVAGRVSFARQVVLQLLLGSDWKREMYNSRRAVAWRNVPPFWRGRANVLYIRHYHEVAI
jgi:hypothetical protein